MKIPKSLLKQIIQEEYAKFNPTDETNKDMMDPKVHKVKSIIGVVDDFDNEEPDTELWNALRDLAVNVVDQYSDAEELYGRDPGEREAKYGKMSPDDARKEIMDSVNAIFYNYLEDFEIHVVEPLVNETFPEEEGSEFEDDFGDYDTLKTPDAESHGRMKRVARETNPLAGETHEQWRARRQGQI